MSAKPRILAFAGSTRSASYNKRLVAIAARAAETAGAEVRVIDLRDFALPLFDEDLESESGPPEAATRLKTLMVEHDGFLISSPEYNSSVSAVLKNAIDWASRPAAGEPPLVAYRGKVVTLMSASPGALGGLRGLVHLRSILGNIGVIVLPDQVAVPRAFEAFQEDGALKDAKQQASVQALGTALAGFVAKLKV
jgi:chromate reductase, NAD(P)H dehydrogenase (quinone)